MAIPQSAESMILDKMLSVLTKHLITNVDKSDKSRADKVILGKPTDELQYNVVISIHMDHPLGPANDTDFQSMGTPRSTEERPYKWPTETTGGMHTKTVIGAIQINIREMIPYETAKDINSAVATRIEQAINRDNELLPFHDDFGQFVSTIDTFRGYGYQAGGGSTSIHIRWIDWRAFIHSENCRRDY